ncbi:c-type cytochrome [Halieaceae bacterium IMCC14734]|uniref:C-type cytochrome n=2 Tax=Candidatus Litorirhabdus singularis TaxID=2518993 RepID=A0ABT3TF99_9GAMM|nr:c-type cytochrome [Candidatus Litorirhabdus singularis]
MLTNEHDVDRVHRCDGECYEAWQAKTGGVVAVAAAAQAAKAAASPAELGKAAYQGCIACHGAGGEGGVGPQLAGQSAESIAGMLRQYKNGETRGAQSSLMWANAGMLSQADIDNLAAFVETL